MATFVITPEMQRANAEAALRQDPGKFRDPGQRWTAKRFGEIQPTAETDGSGQAGHHSQPESLPAKDQWRRVLSRCEVPACLPGRPLLSPHYQQATRWGHKDLGCDAQNMMQMEPVPAIPFVVLAAEYIREFVQQEGGFGGGSLLYRGPESSILQKGCIHPRS